MTKMSRLGTALFAAIIYCSCPAVADSISHVIKKGDTLWTIARKYHSTPAAVAAANGIKENSILKLGRKLNVPVAKSSATSSDSPKSSSASLVFVHTTADGVCLRNAPSTGAGKIAVLPQGATGKFLARKGYWIKIALGDGTCGYVHSSLLDPGDGTVHFSAENKVEKCDAPAEAACADTKSDLVRTALACRGLRYRSGGTSRSGFDCSGFTRYVYAKYGKKLPHSSAAQAKLGTPVSRNELRPGDLVFFHTYKSGISHVGIYIGSGNFVHAARHGQGVRVDALSSSYYSSRYRGARRIS